MTSCCGLWSVHGNAHGMGRMQLWGLWAAWLTTQCKGLVKLKLEIVTFKYVQAKESSWKNKQNL